MVQQGSKPTGRLTRQERAEWEELLHFWEVVYGLCSILTGTIILYLWVGAGSEEAARLLQGQGGPGVVERVHALVASTDTPAAAAGGGTAALLHNTSLLAYAGFAMTAKPSVNLLILLQV